jgi:hypothetical protein
MRVPGTVVEKESGRPLAGLQVRAFDRDVPIDDKLGVAVTDSAGAFRIDYGNVNFSYGLETTPEFYVKVFGANGKKLLFTSKKSIRKEPQVEERYDIEIAKATLG